jgi:hypothetical protein
MAGGSTRTKGGSNKPYSRGGRRSTLHGMVDMAWRLGYFLCTQNEIFTFLGHNGLHLARTIRRKNFIESASV